MHNFKIKSYAKINLALNVVGKKNSLHKIESIISFINIYDELSIKKIKNKNHKIKFIGRFSDHIKSKNSISKLLKILDENSYLPDKYQIIVKKNIPLESGLGGGSMNAACVLNFFIKKKLISIKKREILRISHSIGSDVVLGLYCKSLILKSNNIIKTFSKKKTLHMIIVKPDFGCSTKTIYSQVKNFSKPKFNNTPKDIFDYQFLKKMKNDLEPLALKKYPKLRILKKFLEKIPRIEFVRMTGSGSAIIVYFKSFKKSKEAEKKVKKEFKNYWCVTSKTI